MNNVVELRPRRDKDDKREDRDAYVGGAVYSSQVHQLDLEELLEDDRDDNPLRTSLLAHLQTILGDKDVAEVIALLRDIRTHQDHPEMQKAFEEHNHPIAHEVKDYGKDILELLVDDYLRDQDIGEPSLSQHHHKPGLELHIKHVVRNTLRGYQEVVENIRDDVGSISKALEKDQSISHIRDLIAEIHSNQNHSAVRGAIAALKPDHDAHPIFHGHSKDLHEALATAAYKKGHRTAEQASAYLRGEFNKNLGEHFGESLTAAQTGRGRDSDIYVRNLSAERIKQARLSNPRVNAAFSLVEGLKRQMGQGADIAIKREMGKDTQFSEMLFKVLQDKQSEEVEESVIRQSAAISLEIDRFAETVEPMTELYIRTLIQQDYKVRTGFLKLHQAKQLYQSDPRIAKMVPETCHELNAVLKGEGDLTHSLVNCWLEEDLGNIEFLDHLIHQVSADAQSYLEPDLLKGVHIPAEDQGVPVPDKTEPMSEMETEMEDDKARLKQRLVGQVRLAPPNSAVYDLRQILKAGVANYRTYPPLINAVLDDLNLHNLVSWYESKGGRPEGIVDTYMMHLEREEEHLSSIEEFAEKLLQRIKDSCDPTLYDYLLKWNRRETIPAAPAPPSYRGGGENIPLTTAAEFMRPTPVPVFEEDMTEDEPEPEPQTEAESAPEPEFDDSRLEVVETDYVDENTKHTVEKGTLGRFSYAMPGSTIEVEDGAKADLFMTGENVTIMLHGENARAKIERAAQNCRRLRILDENGRTLQDDPRLELGEGISARLSA